MEECGSERGRTMRTDRNYWQVRNFRLGESDRSRELYAQLIFRPVVFVCLLLCRSENLKTSPTDFSGLQLANIELHMRSRRKIEFLFV